ncbi:MAG TPA: hypothetical protein ENJ95_17185 [Bacteroidetes bacterium]|nr:hypothetical protein [Bacteroidota bacterium]
MNKILIPTLLMLAAHSFGQSIEQYEKLALASFYSKDFPTTLLYSEKAIEMDGGSVSSLFFAGESARLMDDMEKAETYLEKIPDEAKAGYFAVTDYHLGMVKQNLDKRDEAKNCYESYLNKHYNENDLYSFLAQEAIHSLATGDEWAADGSYLDKLPGNINTEQPELAPLRYANKIYFSTVLEENYLPTKSKRKRKKLVKRPVSRIYEAQFNRPARLSVVNPRSAILSASNITLMPDASRMYYTLCSDENPSAQEKCTIWYRNRFYDGTWGPAVKLPTDINLRRYTNTQPSVGYDQQTKKYTLFFVSDRPGGAGGKDIWCSEIGKEDTFGEPYPLPINTEKDEVTPFFHQATQTLFFSSQGWDSKGGFDVFRSKKTNENEWKAPQNMGAYMNTEKDETYYTYHTSSKFAYFVSDEIEEGKKDIGGDIFEARIFVGYRLRLFDAGGKTPLTNGKVEIENLKTGAKGSFDARKGLHEINFKLEPGENYKLTVSAEGFQPESFDLNTENISYFSSLEKNVFLKAFARP